MAEEKQFEASASRLEKAKREGDVARSQELGGAISFGAGLAGAAFVAAPIASAAATLLSSAARGVAATSAFVEILFLATVPPICSALAACAANAAQSGGVRFAAIAFKPDRLNPAENLKRVFSREAAVTAARASIAVVAAACAIVPAFGAIFSAALHSGNVVSIGAAAWSGALHNCALACVVGAVFAAGDYGVQLARWRKRLRMSHEELKRDQKENDGDPVARGRRRSLHRQIARGSLSKVKDAAFVVVNPTHVAVALEYRPPDVPVPRLLVRAADEAARRVRELAALHSVPIIENVPLARALYAGARSGQFIPHETYVAVAEIVVALQGKR